MSRPAIVALGVVAAVAGCAAARPAVTPELSLAQLRDDFNRDAQQPRLLALVSPG